MQTSVKLKGDVSKIYDFVFLIDFEQFQQIWTKLKCSWNLEYCRDVHGHRRLPPLEIGRSHRLMHDINTYIQGFKIHILLIFPDQKNQRAKWAWVNLHKQHDPIRWHFYCSSLWVYYSHAEATICRRIYYMLSYT